MLDASKEQLDARLFLSQGFWDRGRRTWNVCGYYGVRLNFLVRYIPVNQVGLEDLRCRLYTDSRKYLMPGLDLLESGGFEPHFHCIKGEIFSNKHTPPINEFYIILIYYGKYINRQGTIRVYQKQQH